MKRLFITAAITALCLCGCGTPTTGSTSSNASASQLSSSVSTSSSAQTQSEAIKVMPENKPVKVEDNKLESGVYSVSFNTNR